MFSFNKGTLNQNGQKGTTQEPDPTPLLDPYYSVFLRGTLIQKGQKGTTQEPVDP